MSSFANSVLPIICSVSSAIAVCVYVPVVCIAIYKTTHLHPSKSLQLSAFVANLCVLVCILYLCLFVVFIDSLETFELKRWRSLVCNFVFLLYPAIIIWLWHNIWAKQRIDCCPTHAPRYKTCVATLTLCFSFLCLSAQVVLFFISSFTLSSKCQLYDVKASTNSSCSRLESYAFVACLAVQIACIFVDRCLGHYNHSLGISRLFAFIKTLLVFITQVSCLHLG